MRIMYILFFLLLLIAGCNNNIAFKESENNESSFDSEISDADLDKSQIISDQDIDAIEDSGIDFSKFDTNPSWKSNMQQLLDDYVVFSNESSIQFAIVEDGVSFFKDTAGINDLTVGDPIPEEIVSRIGSNTKPMTAVVIMQLVEKGELSLDQTVGEFLPEYEKWHNITIENLLKNQSGIPDYLTKSSFLVSTLIDPLREFTPYELLDFVKNDAFTWGPNGEGIYSDTNWILLGLIIEDITGLNLEDVFYKRIFKPVGMTNTFLDVDSDRIDTLAHGYMDVFQYDTSGKLLPLLNDFDMIDERIIDTTYKFHPSIAWASGAVVSTAEDMLKFMYSLFHYNLLKQETVELMITDLKPVIVSNRKVNYGLGMMKRKINSIDSYGHGGLFPGYGSEVYYLPEIEIYVASLNNFFPDQTRVLTRVAGGIMADLADFGEHCEIDNIVWEEEAETYLDFRFHGVINNIMAKEPFQGIGFMKLVQDETFYIPSSVSRFAEQKKNNQGQEYVEINGYGQHEKGSNNIKAVSIQLYNSQLQNIKSSDTTIQSVINNTPFYAFTMDIEVSEKSMPERMCFSSYSVPGTQSHIGLCHDQNQTFKVGEVIKTYGRFEMEVDPEKVASFFSNLGIPLCYCSNNGSTWSECQ